ncbi:MAG: glycosyltransferase family 2 protein [Deltaproteobacteria bacterium]|nr:glycosyltransferase family 2 protein [Deltaproteobacteria bacterium]
MAGVAVPLALLGYTYVGYPLLVGALARLRPLKVERDLDYTPMVSALLPAYNVASYLDAKLDSLLALDYPADKLEILVMSDGSTDGTDELLARRSKEDPRVRYLRSDQRRGKPSAVNAMKKEARGEILLMTDARQPLARESLRALVPYFVDPDVGCVSGNLVLEGDAGSGVYWRYENWIREQEAAFRSMVGVTGPIYAIRKTDLPELPEDIILDDLYTPMKLRLQGKKLLFEKAAVAVDQAFDDDREFGRKARTLAGNYQAFARLPQLMNPFANPSFLETFSHKLLRLAGPALMATLLANSARHAFSPKSGFATKTAMRGLLGAQVVFYAAAALGPRAGKLPGVARTFVMMNTASVVGLWRWARGAQRVTW